MKHLRYMLVVVAAGALSVPSSNLRGQESNSSKSEANGGGAVCSTGHDLDYVAFAESYLDGDEKQRAPDRAAEVLANGCDRESAAACERLAELYERGLGVEEDAGRADELRERAETLRD